ncbi:hypothetical protein PIB30_096004 [Stylosanthes scabra]|uniref:Secreted protein n=1 Tax=Stylosanthes scabra TaxID=79078 RepID=A0ABU6TWG3_9FABA|nr:hypothetical protein [Stylosanthes scabra]
MNHASSRFYTCFLTSSAFSGLIRRSLCATCLLPGRIDSLWLQKLGSIPGISTAVHANSSPSGCGLFGSFLPGGSRSTRWILTAVSGLMGLGSCSLELCSVASWHLFASKMSPFSVPTSPLSVMDFMVRIDVTTIAPTLFKVGLPMIAL